MFNSQLPAKKEESENVQLLLEKNKTKVESRNYTALHLACEHGDEAMVEYLLCNPNIKNMINQVTKDGCTPLMTAVLNNHLEIVEMLLAKNANVEQTDDRLGMTVLYVACQFKYEAIAKRLLNHKDIGKIVNQSTTKGNTPLMAAAANGSLEIVEMLLSKNANVEQKNENGETALLFANQFGRKIIALLLLAENIKESPVLTFAYGSTPTNVNHTDTSSQELNSKEEVEKIKLEKH